MRLLKMPDGSTTVIIQGKKRFELKEPVTEEPYLKARVSEFPEIKPETGKKKFQALVDS